MTSVIKNHTFLLNDVELTVNLESERVKLELTRNGRLIDSAGFSYHHDLEDKLITGLDKLLKRNRVGLHRLKSYKISENIGENATSYKIVRVFIAGLKV